jgi:hypothetical protein
MKTTTTLLLAALLSSATFFQANAEDSQRKAYDPVKETRRSETQKAETRKAEARETRAIRQEAEKSKREYRSQDNQRNQTDQRSSDNNRPQADHRSYTPNDNQNRRDNREIRENRDDRSNRDNRYERYERADNRNENHRSDRDYHYTNREMRCDHCVGRGYTFNHNGFGRIRCPHCEGRGLRVIREIRLSTCASCYDPLYDSNMYSNYTLEELARLETNRLVIALDLSDRQTERIFQVNLRYLTDRRQHGYCSHERRDHEIRNILRIGQVTAFVLYLHDLANNDLCDNCGHRY